MNDLEPEEETLYMVELDQPIVMVENLLKYLTKKHGETVPWEIAQQDKSIPWFYKGCTLYFRNKHDHLLFLLKFT